MGSLKVQLKGAWGSRQQAEPWAHVMETLQAVYGVRLQGNASPKTVLQLRGCIVVMIRKGVWKTIGLNSLSKWDKDADCYRLHELLKLGASQMSLAGPNADAEALEEVS